MVGADDDGLFVRVVIALLQLRATSNSSVFRAAASQALQAAARAAIHGVPASAGAARQCYGNVIRFPLERRRRARKPEE